MATDVDTPGMVHGARKVGRYAMCAEIGEPSTYAAPEMLMLNQWALTGDWTIEAMEQRTSRKFPAVDEPVFRASCRLTVPEL